jgi:hypothetical protein
MLTYAPTDANKVDLAQLERWYTQSGTPTVTCSKSYSPADKTLSITLQQTCIAAPNAAQPGTRAYVSIRQHTRAYVSIRQHTSAYVRMQTCIAAPKGAQPGFATQFTCY